MNDRAGMEPLIADLLVFFCTFRLTTSSHCSNIIPVIDSMSKIAGIPVLCMIF